MKPTIKGGLILCLSAIVTLIWLSEVTGQMRPPGSITGGVTGRPPGSITGGITGTRIGGPPITITGGISGTRIGGPTGSITGTTITGGSISGSITGRPGTLTGMGGIGGGTEWIYTCTVCGKEVMRSRVKLSGVKNCCPSPIGGGAIGIRPPVGNLNLGGGGNPPVIPPVIPPVTNPPPQQPVNPQPFVPNPSTTTGFGSDTSTTTSSGGTGWFLAIGIAVVLFGLVILGGVIVLIVQSQKSSATPRGRRSRDEYY